MRNPRPPSEPNLTRSPKVKSEPFHPRRPRTMSEPESKSKPRHSERATRTKKSKFKERAIGNEKPQNDERKKEVVMNRKLKKYLKEVLSSIRVLVRSYYDYQEERIRIDNRMGFKKDGSKKKKAPKLDDAMLMTLVERRHEVYAREQVMAEKIADAIADHPLWTEFLVHTKGCGPVMAAVLISEIDIRKAPKVSNLWSFWGYAPGKDKAVKGRKRQYNAFLKSKLSGVLGPGFLQAKNEQYAPYYYNMKHRLEHSEVFVTEWLRNEDKKKKKYKGMDKRVVMWKDAYVGHRHLASIRYMMKEFAKPLYVAWRTIEGLPVELPYSEAVLGKKHGEAAIEREDPVEVERAANSEKPKTTERAIR